MLKIIHVDTAQTWRGGQAQVAALVQGLAQRGHQIVLITPQGSELAQHLGDSPVEIIADHARGEWDLWAGRRLRRLARARQADLVHVHSARAHAMAWWAWSRSDHWPIVVSRRVDFPVGGNWLSRRKYLHPACYYLAISTAVRDVLIRGGINADRIFLVPSGVNPAKFTYKTDRAATRRSLGVADDDLLVCNIGALTDHKDQANLIRAAQIALRDEPRLRFIVLGEGELRGPLEALIAQLDLAERVRLLGFQKDIEPYLAASDLFVLSSHMEGLCTSLLDAMLLGVPVVATRAGGIVDVVVEGETGLLVAPRRSDELADAIVRLIRDGARRPQFAQAAARRAREQFSVERTIGLTEAVYRQILSL